MKKINLLYIISTLHAGGPTNVLLHIVEGIDKQRFDVTILALSPAIGCDLTRKFEFLGAHVITFHMSRVASFFCGRNMVQRLVDLLKPDIIHTHCLRSTYFTSGINTKAKFCATVHNFPNKDFAYSFGKYKGYVIEQVFVRSLRQCDTIFACSRSVSDNLQKEYAIPSIAIQNGIDILPLDNDKQALRQRLGLPVDKTVLISVGSLSSRKNPLFVVKALKKKKFHDSIAVFLGTGPEKNRCKLEESGSIYFLGHKSNAREYMQAADVFVSASRAEGLPMAVIEAMESGLPVVLSDIAPHQEVLFETPEAGRLFKLDDEHSFLDALETYIYDLSARKKASEAARKNVILHFSAAGMSDQYQDTYMHMIDGT